MENSKTFQDKLLGTYLGEMYFEIDSINDVQLKTLIAVDAILPIETRKGIPVNIQELGQPKFSIKTDIQAYINFYKVFKSQGCYVVKRGVKEQLQAQSFINFII